MSARRRETICAVEDVDDPRVDRATVEARIQIPELKVLYLGPFVLDAVMQKKKEAWKMRLDEEYGVDATIVVADPPFQTSDLNCKGY